MADTQEHQLHASTKHLLLTSIGLVVTAALTTLFFIWLGTSPKFAYFNPISISALLLASVFFVIALKKSKKQNEISSKGHYNTFD